MPSSGTTKPAAERTIETFRLLIVSRESSVLRPLWSLGEANSWQLESAATGWGAMERVQSGLAPDLLLLDLPRGDTDGLHILRWLRRLRPELPIILICDPEDTPMQQEAIRLGARDYLVRPLEDQPFEMVIRRHLSATNGAVEADITSDDVEKVSDDFFFVGASPIMRKLRTQTELLAVTNVPVLILGESGSGKETVARLVHKLSVRSGFEFAKVNCAALPSDLLEIELFGQKQNGAGPPRVRPGKLELCEKGTILLDEITEMPLALQTKLMEVLQNKRFVRPGNRTSVEVDVRILASSTTSVESAISENKLREDLCYRLSAYTLQVPPLRQRKEEVPLLLRHFMQQVAKRYGLSPRTFSPGVLGTCQTHSWPGNLRELENFVKRYLMAGGEELAGSADKSLSEEIAAGNTVTSPRSLTPLTSPPNPSSMSVSGGNSLRSVVRNVKLEAERNAIAAALESTNWNRKAAARLLKVSYRSLLYKIEQYQMKPSDSAPLPAGTGLRGNGSGFR
ncbi:MAG: sigma-54 dependent transcriptional regulator [Candidatus Korobacteraceae bacterium]